MSSPQHFQFAVIGGGSAGYAGARTAASLGLSTVVIDGADELGGLCILRGCMPSKTLVESANRNLTLRRAAEFGLSAQPGAVDTAFIRDRKRRLIREFAEYRQGQLEDGRFTLLRGFARISDAGERVVTLAVTLRDGRECAVTCDTLLIATGSVIHTPDVPGLKDADCWTSDTVLDAAEIPESFVVLGGGAIALEMAHYLDGVGRKVTVIQRNTQLLTGTDADVANVVCESFERRGIAVHCGTKLLRVEKVAGGKRVTFEQDGEPRSVEAAEVLEALGRRPATHGLTLDAARVNLDEAGRVLTADTQQTSHPRIFAAGDVCGPLEIVHIAIQQGEIAARNAARLIRGESASEQMDYRCQLFGVFTHPQVATVGLSEAEATKRGIRFHARTYPFDDHGKSLVMGEAEGFVKLICDAVDGRIIGGAVVGPEAVELIHEIVVAMHFGATAAALAAVPHYHPTLSEIWTYPAEDLAGLVNASA